MHKAHKFSQRSKLKVKHRFHFSVLLFVQRIQQIIVLFLTQAYYQRYFYRTVLDVSYNEVDEFQRVPHFADISFVVQIPMICKQVIVHEQCNSNGTSSKQYLCNCTKLNKCFLNNNLQTFSHQKAL